MLFNFINLQEIIQGSVTLKEFIQSSLALLMLSGMIWGIYRGFSSKVSKRYYETDRLDVSRSIEKKADEKDLILLRDRVERKAEKEYVEIIFNKLSYLETKHEAANTQLRKEFLNSVKSIDDKIGNLQSQIIEIFKDK